MADRTGQMGHFGGQKTHFVVHVCGLVEVIVTSVRWHRRAFGVSASLTSEDWPGGTFYLIPFWLHQLCSWQQNRARSSKLSPTQKTMSLFSPFSVTNNCYVEIYNKLHCVCRSLFPASTICWYCDSCVSALRSRNNGLCESLIRGGSAQCNDCLTAGDIWF